MYLNVGVHVQLIYDHYNECYLVLCVVVAYLQINS